MVGGKTSRKQSSSTQEEQAPAVVEEGVKTASKKGRGKKAAAAAAPATESSEENKAEEETKKPTRKRRPSFVQLAAVKPYNSKRAGNGEKKPRMTKDEALIARYVDGDKDAHKTRTMGRRVTDERKMKHYNQQLASGHSFVSPSITKAMDSENLAHVVMALQETEPETAKLVKEQRWAEDGHAFMNTFTQHLAVDAAKGCVTIKKAMKAKSSAPRSSRHPPPKTQKVHTLVPEAYMASEGKQGRIGANEVKAFVALRDFQRKQGFQHTPAMEAYIGENIQRRETEIKREREEKRPATRASSGLDKIHKEREKRQKRVNRLIGKAKKLQKAEREQQALKRKAEKEEEDKQEEEDTSSKKRKKSSKKKSKGEEKEEEGSPKEEASKKASKKKKSKTKEKEAEEASGEEESSKKVSKKKSKTKEPEEESKTSKKKSKTKEKEEEAEASE